MEHPAVERPSWCEPPWGGRVGSGDVLEGTVMEMLSCCHPACATFNCCGVDAATTVHDDADNADDGVGRCSGGVDVKEEEEEEGKVLATPTLGAVPSVVQLPLTLSRTSSTTIVGGSTAAAASKPAA